MCDKKEYTKKIIRRNTNVKYDCRKCFTDHGIYRSIFAFAATCILTSFLNDWLPRDMGREFAHNGKLSAGKPRGAGIIFISVFCIAALLFGEMSVEMFIYLVLVFVEMLTGFMDDAADEPWGEYKKEFLTFW